MSDFTDRLRSLSSRGGTHGNVRYQPLQFENEIEQRRKVFRQKQLKKICWAAFLAIIGFSLLVVGINWYFVDHKGYSAFLMVGVLAFIPGAYGIYEVLTVTIALYLEFNDA